MPRLRILAIVLSAVACSDAPEGTVDVLTGDETDVFSRAPAPVVLIAEKVALDGTRTEIARASLPSDTVNLGQQAREDVGAIAVNARDATNTIVVRGESLFVTWGALEGSSLGVFVQRTNELARMPNGPPANDPTATTMVVGRYVFAASGTATTMYDLLALKTVASPVLSRPARSLAAVDGTVLAIDETGASTYDLTTGVTAAFDPPQGGTFAEIAGGARVSASDGTQYVVGATRASGGASARILVLAADGTTSFAGLTAPREAACATWIEGRGLVVYGGDPAASGAELLATGATVATPLPFPADAVRGCGAAKIDASHVVIAGGAPTTPARVLDLACTTACALAPWPDPIALPRAESFALAPDVLLVLGDDDGGATHFFRATPTGTKEIPLKIPRRGGRLVVTPNAVTVLGGGAGIEQYLE